MAVSSRRKTAKLLQVFITTTLSLSCLWSLSLIVWAQEKREASPTFRRRSMGLYGGRNHRSQKSQDTKLKSFLTRFQACLHWLLNHLSVVLNSAMTAWRTWRKKGQWIFVWGIFDISAHSYHPLIIQIMPITQLNCLDISAVGRSTQKASRTWSSKVRAHNKSKFFNQAEDLRMYKYFKYNY